MGDQESEGIPLDEHLDKMSQSTQQSATDCRYLKIGIKTKLAGLFFPALGGCGEKCPVSLTRRVLVSETVFGDKVLDSQRVKASFFVLASETILGE